MTTTSTTTTASLSAAIPALSDKRNNGGVVVHPSLVYALGSHRATTRLRRQSRRPLHRNRACRQPGTPPVAVAVAVAVATGDPTMRPPPQGREFRGADNDAPRIPTTIHRDRAHCRRHRCALRCLPKGIPTVRPPVQRQQPRRTLALRAMAGAAFAVATAIAAEGVSSFVVWQGGGGEVRHCCVVLKKKEKKVNVSHKKHTNIVTNTNAASFRSSRLISLRARDCCMRSLGIGEVGVRSAIV
jgi:hypothetical protein